jgi:hypothetical protein
MLHARARVRVAVAVLSLLVASPAGAQGLGGAGTVQGTVKDPTGGVMQAVQVRISNRVSGFARTVTTDATGRYLFSNLAPNSYHITVEAPGFQTLERDVDVRTGVPITLDLSLALGATTAVDVVGHADDLLERDPTAHTDIDQSLIARLPLENVLVRVEPDRHDGVSWRRLRLERLLPSSRRSRADPVFD